MEELLKDCRRDYNIEGLRWPGHLNLDRAVYSELEMLRGAKKDLVAHQEAQQRAAPADGNTGDAGGGTNPNNNNNAMQFLASSEFNNALKRVFPGQIMQIDQSRQRQLGLSRPNANMASDRPRVKNNRNQPNQLLQMSMPGRRKLNLPSSLSVDKSQVNQWTQQARDGMNQFTKTMQNPVVHGQVWNSLRSAAGQTVPKMGKVPVGV